MRVVLGLLLASQLLQAAETPAWWKALSRTPRMQSDFLQESESAVFGKLIKQGTLQLDRGGRLRVTYAKGQVLVADGVDLIQYDPAARTAQRMGLRSTAKDMPLLNILVDPAAIETSYHVKVTGENQVILEPKRKDLPKVTAEGRQGFLWRVTWTDGTGAAQVLELKNPSVPKTSFPASTFTFTAPAGTRWIP